MLDRSWGITVGRPVVGSRVARRSSRKDPRLLSLIRASAPSLRQARRFFPLRPYVVALWALGLGASLFPVVVWAAEADSNQKPHEIQSGDYTLSLGLDPSTPLPGQETHLRLRVLSTSGKKSVDDAIVVFRLQREGSKEVERPTKRVIFDLRTREYLSDLLFSETGKYWIHVAVWEVGHQPVAVGLAIEVPNGKGDKPVAGQATTVQKAEGTASTTTSAATSAAAGPAVAVKAEGPSASTGSVPESLRNQVALETTEAGLLKVNWLQKDPRPSRVVFVLKDEAGEEFARQTETREPFYGIFKKSRFIKTIEVELEYSNGVTAAVVLPYSPPPK